MEKDVIVGRKKYKVRQKEGDAPRSEDERETSSLHFARMVKNILSFFRRVI